MSCKLNERNDQTKDTIHLLVTSLCIRDCKYCCNKQYDLNDIPYATDEELREAKRVFITGGEPFMFSNPSTIAHYLKWKYHNIEDVFVYTNAFELCGYLDGGGHINMIDGLTISIKTPGDKAAFERMMGLYFMELCVIDGAAYRSNYLYVFDGLYPEDTACFIVQDRQWQEDFQPDPHSIFRKL